MVEPVPPAPKPPTVGGSRSEKALAAAYAHESLAHTRYGNFSKKAQKEGYDYIASVFAESAENEKEHAKIFLRHIVNPSIRVPLVVPALKVGTTVENLQAAAVEAREHEQAYHADANVADQERLHEVRELFRRVAQVEGAHSQRFEGLLKQLNEGTAWKREEAVVWKCRVCGYVVEAESAPARCPLCDHEQTFYGPGDVLE